MGILDALKTDSTIKEDSDSIGGFSVVPSGIYPYRIKLAYITLSKGKAMALNILFEGLKKEQLKAQFWMTSGEAKGCKNYYINKSTGDKHYLPGFNQANALCMLTVNKEVSAMDPETKTIKLYDYTSKKEEPTEVDMLMELIGKEIFAGVIEQTVDKNIKDSSTGKYVPSGEFRKENEVDKLFRAADKLTLTEIKSKAIEPVFYQKWLDRWDGKTKDKTKKTGVTKGAPKRETGKQAPTSDLFTD